MGSRWNHKNFWNGLYDKQQLWAIDCSLLCLEMIMKSSLFRGMCQCLLQRRHIMHLNTRDNNTFYVHLACRLYRSTRATGTPVRILLQRFTAPVPLLTATRAFGCLYSHRSYLHGHHTVFMMHFNKILINLDQKATSS